MRIFIFDVAISSTSYKSGISTTVKPNHDKKKRLANLVLDGNPPAISFQPTNLRLSILNIANYVMLVNTTIYHFIQGDGFLFPQRINGDSTGSPPLTTVFSPLVYKRFTTPTQTDRLKML